MNQSVREERKWQMNEGLIYTQCFFLKGLGLPKSLPQLRFLRNSFHPWRLHTSSIFFFIYVNRHFSLQKHKQPIGRERRKWEWKENAANRSTTIIVMTYETERCARHPELPRELWEDPGLFNHCGKVLTLHLTSSVSSRFIKTSSPPTSLIASWQVSWAKLKSFMEHKAITVAVWLPP